MTDVPTGDRRGPAAGSWRRRIRIGASVALVIVAFAGVLPRIASYEDVWDRLEDASPNHLALLGLVATWNIVSYWPLLMLSLPGLTWARAAVSTLISTAVSNTVPAGGVVGAGVTVSMYRGWGFPAAAISTSLIVSGIWNAGTKLLMAVAAVLTTTATRGGRATAVAAGVVLLALVAVVTVVVVRPGPVRRVTQWAEAHVPRRVGSVRRNWTGSIERVRAQAGDVIATRWPALTVAAVVSHVSLYLVLAAALHTTAVTGISLAESFGAFVLMRIALLIPLTPGGAGLSEVGLSGLLVAAGGDDAAVVAAVLVFRAVTWAAPVILGGACWLVRTLRGTDRTPGGVATS